MKVGDRASFTTPDGQKYIGKIEKINAKTIKIKAGKDSYMIKKPKVSLVKKTKKSVPKKTAKHTRAPAGQRQTLPDGTILEADGTGGVKVIDAPKKTAPKKTAPKKTAPKKVDKDLLQKGLSIMANLGKEKSKKSDSSKTEEILNKFSRNQVATAFRKAYTEANPGMTRTIKKGVSKQLIIKTAMEEKLNLEKFLTEKAKKEPKQKYILEGFQLTDGGDDPFNYTTHRMEFDQSYPSGLQRFTGKLTKSEAQELAKELKDMGVENFARFYRETPKSRIYMWKDPL